mgnify:CR=1 FL=1
MRRYTPYTILALLFAAIMMGCSQSPVGILESIEFERKIIDDRELANEIPVGGIAQAAGRYFIAAGSLYYRSSTDADYPDTVANWTSAEAPLGNENLTTNALVTFSGAEGNRLYVAYTSQDGTTAAVYSVDPATLPDPDNPDDADLLPFQIPTTSAVFGTERAGVDSVGKLFVLDDGTAAHLAVGVGTSGISRYTLYVSTTAESDDFAAVDGFETGGPIVDAAALPASGTVVFLTSRSIWIDEGGINAGTPPADITGNLPLDDPDDPENERQPSFGGVFFDSAGTLWLSDNEGYLYRSSDNGVSWTANSAAYQISTNNEEAVPFTDFAEVTNGPEGSLILVGTDGFGYRELRAADAPGVAATPLTVDTAVTPTAPDAQDSNYEASELAQASVLAFHVDPSVTGFVPSATGDDFTAQTGDRLFAGTSNLGLWKTLYYGAPPQWLWE